MKNAIQIGVDKTGAENNSSTLRRFTKRVQEAGVLRKVRSLRYHERNKSKFVNKKKALKHLTRKAETTRLIKLGKAVETTRR